MSQDPAFDGEGEFDEVQPDPDSEPEYANPRDARITRDGDGQRLPQEQEVAGLGLVKVRPLNYGDVQDYFGDGRMHAVEGEAIAEVFDRHFIRPDFTADCDAWAEETGRTPPGRVTAGYIEDMKPLMVRDLLMALMDASGIDAEVLMEGTTAQVDVQGN